MGDKIKTPIPGKMHFSNNSEFSSILPDLSKERTIKTNTHQNKKMSLALNVCQLLTWYYGGVNEDSIKSLVDVANLLDE